MKNSLQSLQDQGQSVWLDYLGRSLITSGELKRLIDEDGLRGLTSNPSIFEKAITSSSDYQDMIEAPESQGIDAKALYERIAVRDIQDAADILRPVYLESKRRDGYVSLEVSPRLAHETRGTIEEARRLWRTVAREKLDDQSPRYARGRARRPAIDQRGYQRECHVAVRAGGLRAGGRSLRRRTGEPGPAGRRPGQSGQCRQYFHQPY